MVGTLRRDLRSLPNLITLSRIFLLLVAAGIYFYVAKGPAIILAVIAGVTDYVDGMIARRTGQVTRLGEILDQFSDLVFESLILIVAVSADFFAPIILFAYLLREFWVTVVRRFMATHQLNIPSSILGKLKTNALMWSFLPTFVSIGGFFPAAEPFLTDAAHGFMYAALFLGYASAWGYTKAFLIGYDQVKDL